jgi:hypothetical protein
MDPGAKLMSAERTFGPAPGPGAAIGMAVQAVAQLLLLPWSMFASAVAEVARLANGVRPAATGSGSTGAVPAPPPAAKVDERTTSGAPQASAGTTREKETKMGYEDRCEVEYCEIKLYQYTIVSIKRGSEDILYTNSKLVTDHMEQCEFDAWVIAEYLQSPEFLKAKAKAAKAKEKGKNGKEGAEEEADEEAGEETKEFPVKDEHDKRWLRVSSQLQHTWTKQPLHYRQEQLKLLKKIADK